MNNLILKELKETVNKWSVACFSLMGGVSAAVCILVLAGIFPVYTLLILAGYIPLCALLAVMIYTSKRDFKTFSKRMQISAAASNAKHVMDNLVQSYSDTYIGGEESDNMKFLSDNGVDITSALKQLNSNVEAYNKLASDFLKECNVLEDDMYMLMHNNSLTEYASKAHELRIKSGALGLRNLTDTAFFHELEACTGDIEILENNWQKLSFELDESAAVIEEYIKSLDTNARMTRKKWGERLQEAFAALENLDTDKAKAIFNELIECPINSDTTSVLKNIVTSIDEVMAAK
jgi:HPt (histidine-containing phosphotransfer) domain-containing protein